MNHEIFFQFDTTDFLVFNQFRISFNPNFGEAKVAGTTHSDYGSGYYQDYTTPDEFINYLWNVYPPRKRSDSGFRCYEKAFQIINNFSHSEGRRRLGFMIGNGTPYGREYTSQNIDWRRELNGLYHLGFKIYTIPVLTEPRSHARNFYEEVADRTNGLCIPVNFIDNLSQIVEAILAKELYNESSLIFQSDSNDSVRSELDTALLKRLEQGKKTGVTEFTFDWQVLHGIKGRRTATVGQYLHENNLDIPMSRVFCLAKSGEKTNEFKSILYLKGNNLSKTDTTGTPYINYPTLYTQVESPLIIVKSL
jgi:hypothetical protein